MCVCVREAWPGGGVRGRYEAHNLKKKKKMGLVIWRHIQIQKSTRFTFEMEVDKSTKLTLRQRVDRQ